ncbi:MAG: hypothetical protein K8I30_17775, partial [Anaerolineae bacterium]|nr:hypothetical protein [Anaerolineae bacterium]
MKIVFFGDSLTQGTMGVSYVDKVAKGLRGHHFINAGVNGDTSLNLYRRLDKDVIAHRPDGVFLMIGVNDAISHVETAARPYFQLVKRIPNGKMSPIAFRENMRAILARLQTVKIRAWVALPPLEYNPTQVEAMRAINTQTAQICADMGVSTLDLMALLVPPVVPERPPVRLSTYSSNLFRALGLRDYERLREAGGFTYSFDGVHLTETGAQRIADFVANFLRVQGVS